MTPNSLISSEILLGLPLILFPWLSHRTPEPAFVTRASRLPFTRTFIHPESAFHCLACPPQPSSSSLPFPVELWQMLVAVVSSPRFRTPHYTWHNTGLCFFRGPLNMTWPYNLSMHNLHIAELKSPMTSLASCTSVLWPYCPWQLGQLLPSLQNAAFQESFCDFSGLANGLSSPHFGGTYSLDHAMLDWSCTPESGRPGCRFHLVTW